MLKDILRIIQIQPLYAIKTEIEWKIDKMAKSLERINLEWKIAIVIGALVFLITTAILQFR